MLTVTGMGDASKPLTSDDTRELLDFSKQLDISLLDKVVFTMYQGQGQPQALAQQALAEFKVHPDAWTKVDVVLTYSQSDETKFYALNILEHVIRTKWRALPREQCIGIRNFIVNSLIETCKKQKHSAYLNKLNMILVQILKHDWPKHWPTFISDLIGSSDSDENLCMNNMVILRLLSEEVFDFSSGQLTQAKAKNLKETFCTEFSQVFPLCQSILESSQNQELLLETIKTLLKFLNWIPLGYVFETRLIPTLMRFIAIEDFRNTVVQAFTEIVSIDPTASQEYENELVQLFKQMVEKLRALIPPDVELRTAYNAGSQSAQNFIQNLALFMTSFLKDHSAAVERCGDKEVHQLALSYLVSISEVDNIEVFKICLEFWNSLASDLYRESPITSAMIMPQAPIFMTRGTDMAIQRRFYYKAVLSRMRKVMICRMARPEEVLVVETESGEVVREFMKDTDSIELYKQMRETLVFLTHLDYADTETIMMDKLQKQVDGTEWSWSNLNKLCWAIGSISGSMHREDEKRFLVTVIRDLLGLCEQKRGKDNKAIIASNIMYVVGQYPRFLKDHWKFLKTVVNKLFEFMHESHEGVQDMACDTFIKIANKCRRHFVVQEVGETEPFVEDILANINATICDLDPHQVQTFYEAVGMMISAQTDAEPQQKLIAKYMLLPNSVWDQIIAQASADVDVLRDQDPVRQLTNIIRTNIRACTALGGAYISQLQLIYNDMLQIYLLMSNNINMVVQVQGEAVTRDPLIRLMRTLKKEILKLISLWVSKTREKELATTLVDQLLQVVLSDYQGNIPAAREPEVLSAMATIVDSLGDHLESRVPVIFDAVFQCTLDMINKEFEEWPDHRSNFYLLLQSVTKHCFPALLKVSQEQFKLVLDAVIWAFKHTMRGVSETGLNIMYELLQNITKSDPAIRDAFYTAYYTDILQHILAVLTDSSQQYGFTYHCQILRYLCSIVETGQTQARLSPSVTSPEENVTYVKQYLLSTLKTAFPHLSEQQLVVVVEGLFSFNSDLVKFKNHLRDFLIQIREFTGEDQTDLFLEEREAEIKAALSEKRQRQLAVPGILNPHEIQFEVDEREKADFYEANLDF